MSLQDMRRLTVVLGHPAPYFSPLLRALAARTDLLALYFDGSTAEPYFDGGFRSSVSWGEDLLDGSAHVIADVRNPPRISQLISLARTSGRVLRSRRDSVVVSFGWTPPFWV